jgi:hypothetical protein
LFPKLWPSDKVVCTGVPDFWGFDLKGLDLGVKFEFKCEVGVEPCCFGLYCCLQASFVRRSQCC